MRVSNQAIYDTVTYNLTKVSNDMLRANQTVSSGKRINRLSDDPVGLVSVMNLRSSLEHIGQLQRNINMGNSWLTMGEKALSQMEDILTETKTLCIQMANATQSAAERADAAVVVEGQLQQIFSLANTQVDGRYIFSGTKTDTAPYLLHEGDPSDPTDPTTVTYQGNDTAFEVQIAKDMNVAVGRVGTDIFGNWDPTDPEWEDENQWESATGEMNIFKTLLNLQEHLENNNVEGIRGDDNGTADPSDDIPGALEYLDIHMDHLRSLISESGAKSLRLETKETIIQDLKLTYTERKSDLEDADMAEAIMELRAKETAYQAALASSSKVMKMSLVDYL